MEPPTEKVVYLYHHLPKCGGVSFIRTCEKWFPPRREVLGSYPDAARIAEFARTRLDFDALPPNCFVHGHLVRPGIRPFERYGDYIAAGKMRLITIVRDPLERCISGYFHRQKVGRPWHEPLEGWLKSGRNQLAKYLQVDAENIRARLDSYFVVGTMESLQLTADILALKTGNPRLEVPHLNISPRSDYELSEDAVREFVEANSIDYEIHRYATDRLSREAAGLFDVQT
ncbi:MAG: hypothetical protein PHC88_13295 [Terrimicrobiaceae bacterium]|nr:hypothetical protein [Terrimicrobiaceae bacterium]